MVFVFFAEHMQPYHLHDVITIDSSSDNDDDDDDDDDDVEPDDMVPQNTSASTQATSIGMCLAHMTFIKNGMEILTKKPLYGK